MLDPYLPFIRDTLTQYPRLRATRLFEMVRARGDRVSPACDAGGTDGAAATTIVVHVFRRI